MKECAKINLNYPLAISCAVHGTIIALFSLLAVDAPQETPKETPIYIKKIILKKEKAAPAKKTKNKISIKQYKPIKAAQSLSKAIRTPRPHTKPLPSHIETLNRFAPINRIPSKPNQFQKPDIHSIPAASLNHQIPQPKTYVATNFRPKVQRLENIQSMSPASFNHQNTQPVTYVTTDFKPEPQRMGKVEPKSFSGSLNFTASEPMKMAVTTGSLSRKPFTKPIQIAAIPKGFVNDLPGERNPAKFSPDLPSENSLANLPQKLISGTKHGVPASNGDDLKALKKGYSSKIWQRIANAKFYPRMARKREIEGKPVVEFELRSDGHLMNYLIVRSSSNKTLDKAAIEAVKNASPYPGIPKSLKLKSIRFKLPISFKLSEP